MKILKLIVILAILFVIVVVGGVTAFFAFADPNDFKEHIVQAVFENTGRQLSLDGDLEWAFWPKLRLKAGPLALSNAPGFGDEPFVAIQELQIAVATLPLLKNQIEMDTVKLYGVRINLATNAEGVSNWADLVGDGSDEKGSGDIAAIALGGVDIKDAAITWRDGSSGQTVAITKLNVTTGALAFGDPIAFEMSLSAVANQPALDSDIGLSGTISYDLADEKYHIEPLSLDVVMRGKNLPGGKATLNTTAVIDIDLDQGLAHINQLRLDGLGTELRGDITLTDIESDSPGARGALQLKGNDLAVIFTALELPVAKQIAGLKDRGFDFAIEFDADMHSGNVTITKLDGAMLGASLNARLEAERVNTDTPAAKGSITAHGPDLPSLLAVFGQLQGMERKTLDNLVKVLGKVKDKSFRLHTTFDADMQSGKVSVPQLDGAMLGASLNATLEAERVNTDAPAAKGSVTAKGSDLPSLLAVVGQLQGMERKTLNNLLKVLGKAKDKTFRLQATFDADMQSGVINLPTLEAKVLGNTISGNIASTKAGGDKAALKGNIDASGPDLPSLLAIAATFQGPDSALHEISKSLSTAPNKSFSLKTNFKTDANSGRVDLPQLSAKGLGLSIDGKMTGKNLDSDNGTIDGRLTITGSKLQPLLTALGQRDLAKSIDTIKIEAGINGTMADMTFSPLTMVAKIKGVGKKKAVTLTLAVGSARADLDHETLAIKKLSLKGLGMNITGNVDVTQLKTAPAFSGSLNVPKFNLRNVLNSLNQKLPPMADRKALTSFALTTAFKGTNTSIALTQLTLKLDQTTLKGNLAIADFEGPDVRFSLGIDQINADGYMAPKPQGKARPVTPEAAAAGAAQLPIATLRKLKIKGDLLIGKLQIAGAKMQNVKFSINADGGLISIKPVAASLYNGSYNGTILLDARKKTPLLAFNTNLSGINLEPLLFDMTGDRSLAGIANINVKLKTTGSNSAMLVNGLTGPVKFSINNGIYRGIDVAAMLAQVEVMIESKRPTSLQKGGETRFQSLSGTINFNNGVGTNKDLLLDGSGFKVTGKGTVANLRNNTMKYDAKVIVDASSTQRGERNYNLGGYTIPIRCRGKLGADACKPDIGDIVAQIGKSAVKKELGKQLEKVLGGDAGKALRDLFKF